jgi:hypothetical protein
MSTINLETSEDIKIFLRLLAEESIKDAKASIHDDSKQKNIVDRMKSDSKIFNNIYEQDEEGEAVEVEEEAEDDDVEEPAPDNSPSSLEVSLDSISTAVKDLRSGRSVDDSSMKSQLRDYFDRLEPLEREALLTFMKAFAGILTGQTDGSSAPDPSDPPSSITMSSDDEEVSADIDVESEEGEDPLADDSPEEEPEEGKEDTKPPIKAGSPADLSEIRNRVRNLMRS